MGHIPVFGQGNALPRCILLRRHASDLANRCKGMGLLTYIVRWSGALSSAITSARSFLKFPVTRLSFGSAASDAVPQQSLLQPGNVAAVARGGFICSCRVECSFSQFRGRPSCCTASTFGAVSEVLARARCSDVVVLTDIAECFLVRHYRF